MSDGRKQLMGVLARNLPNVPSALTDAVLNSKWLADRDLEVAAEAWDEGALWAAVECDAICHERQPWLAPGDNPYRVKEDPE